jgi:hypothetical protein
MCNSGRAEPELGVSLRALCEGPAVASLGQQDRGVRMPFK